MKYPGGKNKNWRSRRDGNWVKCVAEYFEHGVVDREIRWLKKLRGLSGHAPVFVEKLRHR